MSAYYTRAFAKPAGFYRSLNQRSTADVYDSVTNVHEVRRCFSPGDTDEVFEVERLVSSRQRKVCLLSVTA